MIRLNIQNLSSILSLLCNSQSDFGNEELGKRGCYSGDVSSLDVDMKARHVTVEELSYSLGSCLDECDIDTLLRGRKPASWWNRGKFKSPMG